MLSPAAHTARTNAPDTDRAQQINTTALKGFFRIAELWGLTNAQQQCLLGGIKKSRFHQWKATHRGDLSHDTLERISYILGIYRALQILLPTPQAADEWIKKTNTAPLFNGKSALDLMLNGNVSDLFRVRQYLDAQRGGWS